MQYFEKLLEIWENIQIWNLLQQKEEETIWCQNQIIILQRLSQKFSSNRNEKRDIVMNKPVHSGLSTIELSKILMYELLHDYVKPKSGEKAKLCYMDTVSFIVYVKTDHIYKDSAEVVETRFDT